MLEKNELPKFDADFSLKPDESQLEPDKIYLSVEEGKIAYALNGIAKVTDIIAPDPFKDENINGIKSQVMDAMAKNGHLTKWQFVRGKTGGANESGKHGGEYLVTLGEEKNKRVYLKQDPKQHKNIAEVFTSHLMRFLAKETGEDPSIIANVDFVKTANGVYVASEFFDGYMDLFREAHLAYQLPNYAGLREDVKNWNDIPSERPGFLGTDLAIDGMIKLGRYKEITSGVAFRMILDDVDLHYENIGVVPITSSGPDDAIPLYINGVFQNKVLYKNEQGEGCIEIMKIRGENYYVYEQVEAPPLSQEICIKYKIKEGEEKIDLIPSESNARAVHIDFGGSLADNRSGSNRKFDGEIHIDASLKQLFRYRPSRNGPPPYFNKLPKEITTKNHEFYNCLARFSTIAPEKITAKVYSEIDEIVSIYGNENIAILKNFANTIGVENVPNNKDELSLCIKNHLKENILKRQAHARVLFVEYFRGLDESAKVNLSNIITCDDNELHTEMDRCLKRFYQNLIDDNLNPDIQRAFQRIKKLKLNVDIKDLDDKVNEYKRELEYDVLKFYLNESDEEKLKEKSLEIIGYCNLAQEMFDGFEEGLNEITTSSRQSDDLKASSIAKFISRCDETQAKMNVINNPQNTLRTCHLIGALLGCLIGASVGLSLGAASGFLVAGPIGAVGGGVCGLISGTILGAGLGASIAESATDLFKAHFMKKRDNRPTFFSRSSPNSDDLEAVLQQTLGKVSIMLQVNCENLKQNQTEEIATIQCSAGNT